MLQAQLLLCFAVLGQGQDVSHHPGGKITLGEQDAGKLLLPVKPRTATKRQAAALPIAIPASVPSSPAAIVDTTEQPKVVETSQGAATSELTHTTSKPSVQRKSMLSERAEKNVTTTLPVVDGTSTKSEQSAKASGETDGSSLEKTRSSSAIPTTRTSTTTTSLHRSTTKMMDLVLHDAIEPPLDTTTTTQTPQQSVVLVTIATCDSLVCPADYDQRHLAGELNCRYMTCSLEADLHKCCERRAPWWIPFLGVFSAFCCLSMLCGLMEGIHRHCCYKGGRRRRTQERIPRSRSDEGSEDSWADDKNLLA